MFRFPIAGVLGAVIAASLFYLLSGLVTAPLEFRPAIAVARLPTVRVASPTVVDDPPPFVKPKPSERPSVPGLPTLVVDGPAGIKGVASVPVFHRGPIAIGRNGQHFGGGGSDGDATPLVRVTPQYPVHLQARNVEGWVRVRFNIAADGTVRDARVVDSQPQDFDAAALAAVSRWRYRPRVEGGTAVERVGFETILRFELED